MKHHYKNFNITLGNHFIFDIEIQKEKVMVLYIDWISRQ